MLYMEEEERLACSNTSVTVHCVLRKFIRPQISFVVQIAIRISTIVLSEGEN